MDLTIYGIGSCDSCRKARKWLTEQSIDHTYHDFREEGLTIQMLERWSGRMEWHKLLNTRSLTWRKIPDRDRNDMTKSKAFAAMIDQPTLVKRPVLECDEFIALGFNADNYDSFLGRNDR